MKTQVKGSVIILIATIIWGTAFVAQSTGVEHMSPYAFQALRALLGAAVLLPIIWIADKFTCKGDGKNFFSRWKDRALWKAGLFSGIPLSAAMLFQQVAIAGGADAGKAAFLTSMYIVFTPLLGIFIGQKPSRWIPLSVVLGVAGLYCLSCVGVSVIASVDLLLLVCAVFFAIQILAVSKFANDVDCLRLNCICAFIGGSVSAVIMLVLQQTPSLEAIKGAWLPLCYTGILSMGVAYSLQNIGQKYLPSATASLLMSAEAVFGVLAGWLILDERLSAWEGFGCVLLFSAVILSQLPDQKTSKTAAQAGEERRDRSPAPQ